MRREKYYLITPKGMIEYYEKFCLLVVADTSSIAHWLHNVPRPPLAQNQRNRNGASAGKVGHARQRIVGQRVWPPKVDSCGRTAAAMQV